MQRSWSDDFRIEVDDYQEKCVLIGREICTLTVWGSKQVGDE